MCERASKRTGRADGVRRIYINLFWTQPRRPQGSAADSICARRAEPTCRHRRSLATAAAAAGRRRLAICQARAFSLSPRWLAGRAATIIIIKIISNKRKRRDDAKWRPACSSAPVVLLARLARSKRGSVAAAAAAAEQAEPQQARQADGATEARRQEHHRRAHNKSTFVRRLFA